MIFNLHSNNLACRFELETLVGARSKMKFGILWNWIQRLMCRIKASWEEIRSSQYYGPKLGQKWNFSELDFSFINRCAFRWAMFSSHFFINRWAFIIWFLYWAMFSSHFFINRCVFPWAKFPSHFISCIGEGSLHDVKPFLSTMASRTALIPC